MKQINHPFNFAIGIICFVCFVSNIFAKRDGFDIALMAVLTAFNILVGFTD